MSLLFADGEVVQSVSSASWTLVGASIAWVGVWIQLVVLPFFNKRESLHKDYFASGRKNSAQAAIEANKLIPPLAAMFMKAKNAQPDKRRKIEDEIEALLQAVELLPDLENARHAMAAIEELDRSYAWLNKTASWLWKLGLAHSVLTPLLPVGFMQIPLDDNWKEWIWIAIFIFWLATFAICLYGVTTFHSTLGSFISALEVENVGE